MRWGRGHGPGFGARSAEPAPSEARVRPVRTVVRVTCAAGCASVLRRDFVLFCFSRMVALPGGRRRRGGTGADRPRTPRRTTTCLVRDRRVPDVISYDNCVQIRPRWGRL